MSYILEALRKSHHDREQTADRVLQRSAVEVRQMARRRQLVLWAGTGLLAVNTALLAWLITYGMFSQDGNLKTAAVDPVPSTPPGISAVQMPIDEAVSGMTHPHVVNDATLVVRDMALERQQDLDRRRNINSLATTEEDGIAGAIDSSATRRVTESESHFGSTEDSTLVLSENETTIADADTAVESMPLFTNMDEAFRSKWAALSLDVHVFSPAPTERFVFINMEKYREGETTKEGLLVSRIVADGVILEGDGQRFRLLPQ